MVSKSVAGAVALSLILSLLWLSAPLAAVPAPRAGNATQADLAPQSDPLYPRQGSGNALLLEEVEEVKPGLHLVSSDEHGIVLELFTPTFQVEQRISEDGPCHLITVAGYGETDTAGWPRLPVKGAMVGIPVQAELTLTVLQADNTVALERYELCPVPRPIVEMDGSGAVRYRGMESVRDPEAYAANTPYPSSLAEIASTGFIRSQRVTQLRFHPFQYNPVSRELQHNRRIRVRLDFGVTADRRLPTADNLDRVTEGSFEQALRSNLVNYEEARQWRVPPQPQAPQATFASQNQPSYKILVDEDGVYQVTYADLLAAGVEVSSVVPRTFQLHNQGEEVAIYVVGEEDDSFDPGDHILFYGQKMNTKYTNTNVYWLTWGEGDGRRMAGKEGTLSGTATLTDSFKTTFHWEKDLYYQSDVPGGGGEREDHWFGGFIFAYGSPASETYTFTLSNVATTPYSATVRGLLFGWSYFGPSPDHHTRVYLNGHLIDDVTWDGWRDYEFEHTIPHSYLIEGTNAISVECPLDLPTQGVYDIVYANWFEIDYRDTYVAEDDLLFFDGDGPGTWEFQVTEFSTSTLEVYDVTAPVSPTRILSPTVEPVSSTFTLRFEDTITAEHHYIALVPARRSSPLSVEEDSPSDLHSITNGADYVIITHADFYTDVLPLAAHRAAQELRTTVVDVQDVYDEFSYGIFDPTAIHDLLAYAYTNWVPPAPTYVLLVGDGNYDFKDNFGRGEPNYIPPYLAYADPWIGETAADNRYVCVSGEDTLPDMHLGRLPVKTTAETNALVAKILTYEQNLSDAGWNRQVLFVADNPDSAGNFHYYSDVVADHYLPAPYTAQKVYYGLTHLTSISATNAITNAINEGRLLVNYIGHAGPDFWAWEHLLDRDDLNALTNSQALPLMVPMTCLEGYYIHPSPPGDDFSSLGESIVRASGGGAVASWSPTGMGVVTGHDVLNQGLFQTIFFDGVVQLGPATTQSKLYLYSHTSGYRELLDTYLLMGDPALALNVLPTDLSLAKAVDPPGTIRAGETITYTLTYSNAGPATAHHVVISDVLPAPLLSPTVFSTGAVITPRVGSRLVWDVADLAAGEGGTITITAAVSPTFTGVIANTATITATAVETDTANNVAGPVITGVNAPDLVIDKRGPADALPGSVITYTLVYSNVGTALADQVVISDILPSELISVSIVSAGAIITPRASSRFVWDVADLMPGDGGYITLTAMLTPTYGGPLTNTVTIATVASEPSKTDNVAVLVTLVWHRVYLPLVLRNTLMQVYLPLIMKQ